MFSLLRQTQLDFLRQQSSEHSSDRHAPPKKEATVTAVSDETLNLSDYLSNIRKDILSNTHPYAQPNSSSNSPSNKYKQVARIICHIRDDIHAKYPQVIMPTRRMIECLVFNAFDQKIKHASTNTNISNDKNNEDWHSLVIETLKNLRDLTDAGLFETTNHCSFTKTDGTTPLFPSFELFDEWDAHKFSQTLLFHLQKELN